jgi:hypothetical protein
MHANSNGEMRAWEKEGFLGTREVLRKKNST